MTNLLTRILIFCVCAVVTVGMLGGVAIADNEDPDPYLKTVDIPDSVTVGESFSVDVVATNYGGPSGKYSTITVSSPTLNENGDKQQAEISSHTFGGYTTKAGSEETIYDKTGESFPANYVLAEGGTLESGQWGSSEDRELSVKFTPEEAGTFVIYVRTTLTDDGTDQQFTDPQHGSETDQQGYTVRRYEVDVREKPEIDAAIRDVSVDDGDFERGDTVDSTLRVENTGNREHTFFVGYSVYDEIGKVYDNHDSTGKTVTLDPGATEVVDVEWTVQDDAAAGMYDARFSVWKESDRDNLNTRLADERRNGVFRVREEPNIDAAILDASVDNGDFQKGNVVDGTVRVKNTGNREHTFFVGYSVYDESDRDYDNHDSTGKTVTLEPDESETVEVEWTVQDDAAAGMYDARFSVWKESDRDNLYTRLADIRQNNEFEVSPLREVSFTVSKKSSIEGFAFSGDPISGATIQIAGKTLMTDSEGKVSTQLPVDTYKYSVSAEGYESVSGQLTMHADTGLHIVSVPLVRDGVGVLETEVVDEEGRALGGNMYRILVDGSQRTPNAEGELLLEAGTHTVTVEPTDFGETKGVTRVQKQVTLAEGKRKSRTFSAIKQNKPDISDLSITILSIDSKDNAWNGYRVGESINSIKIRVTGPNGSPVTASELILIPENSNQKFTLISQKEGIYTVTDMIPGMFPNTEYYNFSLQYLKSSDIKSFKTPVVSTDTGLRAPIQGWGTLTQATTVIVNEKEYTTLRLIRDGEYEKDVSGYAEEAWIVFNNDGTLVTDPSIRKKAALTGMVAHRTRRANAEDVDYFLEEYPSNLNETLTYSEIGSFIVTVRDTSAELLGSVGGAAATGGTSIAAQSTVTGAIKTTAKKLSRDVLKNYLKKQFVGSEIESNPLGTIEKAIKWKARDEIIDAAIESKEAGRILDRHIDGNQWNYSDAMRYWESKNESVTDGVLYTKIRTNMLPDADAQSQLIDISKKVAEGATGVPVGDLTSLITEDQFGYISDAVEQTGRLRAIAALQSRAYGQYSREATQQADDQYGNQVLYSSPDETVKSASISLLNAPTGTYVQGQTANATVRVENTGDTTARFFVGYSVSTAIDGKKQYFDNHDTTGHYVSISPGESIKTNVSWIVQHSAPPNQQYNAVVAVWPSFPSHDIEPFQTRKQINAFRVVRGSEFQVTSLEVADTGYQVGEKQIIVADVENTGTNRGSKLLNLSIEGNVVDQEIVEVAAGETASGVFTHSFKQPGTYTLETGEQRTTLSVTKRDVNMTASLELSRLTATVNETVTFDASDSTAEGGSIVSYRWDFNGDGTVEQTTNSSATTYTYVSPGEYEATVIVVNNDGKTAKSIRSINIDPTKDQPRPSSWSLSTTASSTTPGSTATLLVNVSNELNETTSTIVDLSVPDSISIVSHSDAGGEWSDSDSKWLWQTVPAGKQLSPQLTVNAPSSASPGDTFTIEATLKDASGEVVTKEATIVVQETQSIRAAVAGSDGEIGDIDLLQAIEKWRTGEEIPKTGGKTLSDIDILKIIEKWRTD